MGKKLLIIGASTYAVVASEIAADMNCFEKIDFIDDQKTETPTGIPVVGTSQNLAALSEVYDCVCVAIGNSRVRLSLLEKLRTETGYEIVSLVSPRAYVAPSAQVMPGCIIEPMAVVHAQCVLETGCLISAGAVVNHASRCCEGVHVDCNATVEGYCLVPVGTKIAAGTVYDKKELMNR